MTEERNIFEHVFGPFFGGEGRPVLYADPAAVNRKLRAMMGGDPNGLLEMYKSPSAEIALPAAERYFDAIATAFGVPRFNQETGSGLVEDELINLWNAFQDWLKKKRSSMPTTPTSAPPMGSGLTNGHQPTSSASVSF